MLYQSSCQIKICYLISLINIPLFILYILIPYNYYINDIPLTCNITHITLNREDASITVVIEIEEDYYKYLDKFDSISEADFWIEEHSIGFNPCWIVSKKIVFDKISSFAGKLFLVIICFSPLVVVLLSLLCIICVDIGYRHESQKQFTCIIE